MFTESQPTPEPVANGNGQRRTSTPLTVITGNKNKFAEIVAILADQNIRYQNVDLPEYQGDEEFIVTKKCEHAARIVGGPVIVEDCSFRLQALNSLPGPYVKWFIESIGHEGLYKLVENEPNKNASALCYVAYSDGPEAKVEIFVGELTGRMVPVRGDWKFGFPSFLPDGHELTLAEMDDDTKNMVSHRRKALDKLRQFIAQSKC